MTSSATAAAIIAGGQARRFGGLDKTRLVVRGRPIIVRQVDILQRVASPVFIIASQPERFEDLGLPVHADLVSGVGTLGGIHTALAVTDAERVLVVAGDQPFLSADLLRHLAGLADRGDGAWIRTARGVEPLIACYRQRASKPIQQAIAEGDLKAADLGRRLRMVEMGEADVARFGPVDRLLTNINTPADYARIQ